MKCRWFGILLTIMLSLSFCMQFVTSWPVSNPEIIAKSMNEIPQWHCLRYFKHDVHLMRRCRNYRLPLIQRPDAPNMH